MCVLHTYILYAYTYILHAGPNATAPGFDGLYYSEGPHLRLVQAKETQKELERFSLRLGCLSEAYFLWCILLGC